MSPPPSPSHQEPGSADTSRPANKWAVASFVLGIVSLVPLSLIAGITALVKVKDRRESGRGLAVAGMVISMLWTAVWVYSPWPKDGLITGTLESGPMLQVGQCYEGTINSPVSCDRPHSNEVFAVLALSRFPDSDAEQKQIANRCKDELPKYSPTAGRDPQFQVDAWPPGTESRYMDNHSAGCVAHSSSGRVGSIRDRAILTPN